MKKKAVIMMVATLLCSGYAFGQYQAGSAVTKPVGPEVSGEYFKRGTIIDRKWTGNKILLKRLYNGYEYEATISKNNKVIKNIKVDRCVLGSMTTQEYVRGQAKFVYRDNDGLEYTCFYKTNQ